MWWLIILTLHKSLIVCQIQSPQATWATDFYKSTFQRCESTIHIIFNYVRAEQDHCLYNITGWRKWDSALLPRELTGSRWWPSAQPPPPQLSLSQCRDMPGPCWAWELWQEDAWAGGSCITSGKRRESPDCSQRFTAAALRYDILIKKEKKLSPATAER